MKKRFLCLMLTLIMLVSLVPMGAISASAASFATSDKAITVLKKMTTFKDTCYKVADTQEYRIGYGTVCTQKKSGHGSHTITEKQADTALREVLKEMDKKVNAFASANKLSLKQNQHDALVVFSYNVGTAWMNGNGAVKTAIVNGAGSNELLSAMATVQNDMARRKIEVNMYVNGIYSNVIPETFRTVTYNAHGGTMIPSDPGKWDQYTMQFDTTVAANHIPVPTKTGFTFLGWYNAETNGQRVPTLNAKCADATLHAVWQNKTLKDDTARLWEETPKVNYVYKISQLPSLHAYLAPNGKENDAGTKWLKDQKSSTEVTIFTEYMDAKGVRWGNIDGHGWIVMPGSSAAGIGGSDIECDVTVTVTNSYVNSRRNATIFSPVNGSYTQGSKLRIINTASADGFLWGQIAKSADDNTAIGWVALLYTNWNSVKDNGGSAGGANNTNAIARATVTYNGYLNLRNGAGMDNTKIVGSLYKNETVNIYEIKTVNGHQWGRTNGGWLCLTYTEVTMLNGNKAENISNEGALSYVFSGLYTNDSVAPKVSPRDTADSVQQFHEFEDSDKVKHTVNLWPKADTAINIHNMMIRGAATWVKISWRVDLDDNGENDTTKYGWMRVENSTAISGDTKPQQYYGKDVSLAISTHPVQMDPVKFTVVNETTVRDNPDSGANALPIKLNKGVEIQVNAIKLVGETIWGYIDNEHVRLSATKGEGEDDPTVVGGNNSEFKEFDGWINLSSKYVTRSSMPTIEGDKTLTPTGKIATIVGSDSVNVRITGSTSGQRIGSLKRGTTANVLEVSENGDWYNLDVDVDNNPATGSWVYKQYVEISDGTVGGSNGGSSNTPAPVITGKGVVANTYAGVNVREGAGQAYRAVGKLLPGTVVDVLEIKQSGAAKWARIAQGWICMDYVTMLSQETVYPEGTPDKDGSTIVGSYDEIDRTTTTAVYTGHVAKDTYIYATTEHNKRAVDFAVREAKAGENLTIYELIAVTEVVEKEDNQGKEDGEKNNGHGSTSKETITSYWARVNDGYIFNPHDNITLDALDEKVHTLTGNDTLNVRAEPSQDSDKVGKLEKGDQVKVTALSIEYNKVWGRVEVDGKTGWVRLDYMSEGAYKVQEKPAQPDPAPTDPIIGAGSSTGGMVTNSKGYRYTGKVINTNQVNVRAMPNTTSKVTTTLKSGASLVIYETTTAENMAWGRCDAGWVYLYYVDLTPVTGNGAVDARVVANNKAGIIYSDSTGSDTVGTYAGMSVIDIYEIVNGRARTDLGWITTDDLL